MQSQAKVLRVFLPMVVVVAAAIVPAEAAELTVVTNPDSAAGRIASLPAPSATAPFSGTAIAPLRYDDGETDHAYGPLDPTMDLVMRFELPREGMRVREITPCLLRWGGNAKIQLQLTFWAADGPGETPGSLLATVPVSTGSVPVGMPGAFITFNLANESLVIPSTAVYVGVRGGSADDELYVCGDADGGSVEPGYFDLDQSGNWNDLRGLDAGYTALMLRGVFEDDQVAGPCSPDGTTLCLDDGRFAVQARWRNSQGGHGDGGIVPASSATSGALYFSNSEDWQVMVKVLDHCQGDGHFWVSFASDTTSQFALIVTDTASSVSRVYFNQLGQQAGASTDQVAFSTCGL